MNHPAHHNHHRHHHRRHRRSRRKSSWHGILISIAVLILATGGFFAAFRHNPYPTTLVLPAYDEAPSPIEPAPPAALPHGHAVYPYSVVKGGVHSPEELKDAVLRDPVVAKHYSGFNLDQTRLVKLAAAKFGYVSYRIGDKVYWTSKIMCLAKGEEVLTDGTHYARTRCGNQVQDKPGNTSPNEPSERVLEEPENSTPAANPPESVSDPGPVPPTSITPELLPPDLPFGTVPFFPIEPPSDVTPPPTGSSPIIPPFFGGTGGGGSSTPPVNLTPPPGGGTNTPPVTPTPEPGTLILFGSGLAAYAAAARRKLRR